MIERAVKSICVGLLGLLLALAPTACRERPILAARKDSARMPAGGLSPTTTVADAVPRPNRAVGVGEVVPDFALTDQTGKTVRLSEMRGEPVALTFLYTQCPVSTACPMTTAKFSSLAAMLKERKFGRLLVVTVDPQRDTPTALAEYARKAGADPRRWKFLTGDAKSVAEVATHFGVMYYTQGAQIVHTQAVAVVDREGRLSTIYYGEDWQPETLLRDLTRTLHE